jgi:hypothetical protein
MAWPLHLILFSFLSVVLIAFGWYPCCCRGIVSPTCQFIDFTDAVATISNQYGNCTEIAGQPVRDAFFGTDFASWTEALISIDYPYYNFWVICYLNEYYLSHSGATGVPGFVYVADCDHLNNVFSSASPVVYFSASPFVLVFDVFIPAANFFSPCPAVDSGLRITITIP